MCCHTEMPCRSTGHDTLPRHSIQTQGRPIYKKRQEEILNF